MDSLAMSTPRFNPSTPYPVQLSLSQITLFCCFLSSLSSKLLNLWNRRSKKLLLLGTDFKLILFAYQLDLSFELLDLPKLLGASIFQLIDCLSVFLGLSVLFFRGYFEPIIPLCLDLQTEFITSFPFERKTSSLQMLGHLIFEQPLTSSFFNQWNSTVFFSIHKDILACNFQSQSCYLIWI